MHDSQSQISGPDNDDNQAHGQAQQQSDPQDQQQSGQGDRLRVLMVDDDPHLLHLIRLAVQLEEPPFEIETTTNGVKALLLYRQARESGRPFNGIIVDIIIPGVSGLALANEIRQQDSEIPLAILTAYADEQTRDWAKRLKVTAFWSKPLIPHDLLVSIAQWLQEPIP